MGYSFKHIFYLGDTHEVFIINRLLESRLPEGSLVIHVGDLGLGFGPKIHDKIDLAKLNETLVNNDLTLWAIRGNHDDPQWWNNQRLTEEFSNIELVPDYTAREVNGEKYLFVGGAISVDRNAHYSNGTPVREQGRTWWADEVVEERDLAQISECDVLITHTCPSYIGPPTKSSHMDYYAKNDPTLLDELTQERHFMDQLVNKTKPRLLVCGHMHRSEILKQDGKLYRILDINELW